MAREVSGCTALAALESPAVQACAACGLAHMGANIVLAVQIAGILFIYDKYIYIFYIHISFKEQVGSVCADGLIERLIDDQQREK